MYWSYSKTSMTKERQKFDFLYLSSVYIGLYPGLNGNELISYSQRLDLSVQSTYSKPVF
jgi:hypothetical protein